MARVVVTRPAGRESPLVERLEAAGHEVAHVPLVAIEPLGDGPVDVEGYDWVVLTSATGARELSRRMRGTPARVAAIGPALDFTAVRDHCRWRIVANEIIVLNYLRVGHHLVRQ